MLARLRVELQPEEDKKMSNQKAVILQGILMEQIEGEYAEALHQSKLHPYSQYVYRMQDKYIWVLQTLNKEAYEKIIVPVLDEDFQGFRMEHDDTEVKIVQKTLETACKNDFMKKYYFADSDKYIRIRFQTPVSFKSGGAYVNYPDISLIYKSLMNKYDSASEQEVLQSEELLEELVKSTKVLRYDLHSCNYSIGKAKIPSFMGNMLLRIDGPQGIVNFSNMLFQYGEYSGIGIKSAMGMGSMRINEEERGDIK